MRGTGSGRRVRRGLGRRPLPRLLLGLVLGLAGCGGTPTTLTGQAAGGAAAVSAGVRGTLGAPAIPPAPTSPAGPVPAVTTGPAAATSGLPQATAQAPRTWSLTVYYTAVESYHRGPMQPVTGCPLGALDCSNGITPLGSYPADFLQAVREEGAGRITEGSDAGRYLLWDPDHGWSVDTAPRDAAGDPLQPFVSAATDDGIALGIDFRVLDCGVETETGVALAPGVCHRIEAARWEVDDRNGEAAGGHDIVLYVGEEDQPDFDTTSPLLVDTVGARTTLR